MCEEEEQNIISLETTVDDLGYDNSLECISDSEVLEDFMARVLARLGYSFTERDPIFMTHLEELDFIFFDEYLNGDVTVEVDTEGLIEFMDN